MRKRHLLFVLDALSWSRATLLEFLSLCDRGTLVTDTAQRAERPALELLAASSGLTEAILRPERKQLLELSNSKALLLKAEAATTSLVRAVVIKAIFVQEKDSIQSGLNITPQARWLSVDTACEEELERTSFTRSLTTWGSRTELPNCGRSKSRKLSHCRSG